MSAGPSVSGKPWPRLMLSCCVARADITVKMVVPVAASREFTLFTAHGLLKRAGRAVWVAARPGSTGGRNAQYQCSPPGKPPSARAARCRVRPKPRIAAWHATCKLPLLPSNACGSLATGGRPAPAGFDAHEEDRGSHQAVQAGRGEGGAARGGTARDHRP